MSSIEIVAKLSPKTQSYATAGGGVPDLTWQDVLQALQGADPGKVGFALYVYGGDELERKNFYAGLFMEVMQRPEVIKWREIRQQQGGYNRNIERMCLMAIAEWRDGKRHPWTHEKRAKLMGVSRGTWNRKYRLIYQTIVATPVYWQDELERLLRKRLR